MDPHAVERRLAAILVADVAGYSRLMAEDEEATIRTLGAYRAEVELLVGQHRGRLVDFTGDDFLAEFPTALEAVRSAVEIQKVLAARNSELAPERRLEFRMGVHLGDVAADGERLYGDGVNIAARLQGMAEPGGVCVSGHVRDLVQSKLDLSFDDLGSRSVKNIPEPIRVFRLKLEAAAMAVPAPRRGVRASLAGALVLVLLGVGGWGLWNLRRSPAPSPEGDPPGLPDFPVRSAIAVLPFENLSGDAEQEYFADGITEDLITKLARGGFVPVIARNSTFTYKGRAVNVQQVGRELGARYVVEGSVRKVGTRVRISAQLIDATNGHHVWVETYDRELKLDALLAIQDEITASIRGAMGPQLQVFEERRIAQQTPQNLDAWDLTMRAWQHMRQRTKDGNASARSLAEQAIERDPFYAHAFAVLAISHFNDLLHQWTSSPAQSIAELRRAAQRSVSLDSQSALGQMALAGVHQQAGEREEMIAAAERAIELDPSWALGRA